MMELTKKTVLCVGLNPAIDTTIQLGVLSLGTVNRAWEGSSHPAGKALNVAKLLSQLGGGAYEVLMTGFLGADNAHEFTEAFSAYDIKNHCILVAGATRQNIKVAEQDGRMTDINGAGFVVTQADKTAFAEALPTLCAKADVVVVSGSLPKGVSLEDFSFWLSLVKNSGAKLVVDTSGDALKAAVGVQPWLIKPNADELFSAFGLNSDTKEAQREAFESLKDSVTQIVLSRGEAGVTWLKADGSLVANAPKVNVLSTVGAGDSLLSGMVHGFLMGGKDAEVLSRAVALAAHGVSLVGVGVPDEHRWDELQAQITVSSFE